MVIRVSLHAYYFLEISQTDTINKQLLNNTLFEIAPHFTIHILHYL